MTPEEIYEWLLERGVKEPAVLTLGSRHVIGRWEGVGEVLANGFVCRAGNVAIMVLGEGESWTAALNAARVRLVIDRRT